MGYSCASNLLSAISTASGTDYSFAYGAFDLVQSIQAGARTLIRHSYSTDGNHQLKRSDYGNGDSVSYGYDSLGRTTSVRYEDGAQVDYTYDNNGNLGLLTDSASGRRTQYFYDFQDRLMRWEQSGSGYANSVTWGYDDNNNLSTQKQTLNGTTYTTSYTYDKDNRLTKTTEGTVSAGYTYDTWGNPLTTTGSLASTLGEQTPLRYRGYVYDTETGLYYLQSRYYNPTWGRFINADSLIDNRGVHTQNVFAYCGNNPVNHVDSDGHSALAIVGIVCAGALIAAASYLFVKTVTSRDFQNSWKAAVNSAICSVNGAIDRIQEKIKKSFEKARAVPSYKRYEEDHHIVAQKAKTAEPARRILEKVGIDYYNDEVNHVMLKTGLHRRLHSKLYYAWVNDRITQAYERGEGNLTLQREYVIFELGRIRMELQVLNEFFPY